MKLWNYVEACVYNLTILAANRFDKFPEFPAHVQPTILRIC